MAKRGKAKRGKKKMFYASLVLLIIIIAGIFIYVQKTSNPALSDCIKAWQLKHPETSEYYSGMITVHFISGVAEQEAKQLIQQYELPILKSYFDENRTSYSFDVEVPIKSEVKWLCRFQSENAILVDLAIAVPKFLVTS